MTQYEMYLFSIILSLFFKSIMIINKGYKNPNIPDKKNPPLL